MKGKTERTKRKVKQELWPDGDVVASIGRIVPSIFHGEKFQRGKSSGNGGETGE